ncbi:SMI1/KNR4 family protein [Streptomyces fradiae]|uniref:SMI1/KNR4 family protein n=1 Tax=Streptomyces fradiae TaxID=1906 RepID=UPI002941E9EA|nr:SMI1/KNR4 family protein [Streptomyces fradiae]WOI62762.1 SMI1/KNR4 family protein [Streptomyces fradiae]
MDALIGTQTPDRRLTDPATAVAALERVVPELGRLRRTASSGIDWAQVERYLGVGLPSDYKLLAGTYPSLVFGDFLHVGFPPHGREKAWAEDTSDLEILAEWCQDAETTVPLRPFPAPGGLLPWATSYQGDYFLWHTREADPDEWTITVASRNGGWWHYAGGAVQFLADLVGGSVALWELPPVWPSVRAPARSRAE